MLSPELEEPDDQLLDRRDSYRKRQERSAGRWTASVVGTGLLLILVGTVWIYTNIIIARPIRSGNTASNGTVVLMISLDGMRADFLLKDAAPNLRRVHRDGIKASLVPAFPSLTFPNHYTIVTGLYPESHGIVANTFYDPMLNDHFSYNANHSTTDGRWFNAAEPLWVTAVKNGKRAACLFWPGCEAEIRNTRPTYYYPYSLASSMSSRARSDKILEWLRMPPSTRPSYIAAYFSVVDEAGHQFGPDSSLVDAAIAEVDVNIGRLVDGIFRLGMENDVNLIITSDHGLTSTGMDYVIRLEQMIDINMVEVMSGSPVVMLQPKNNNDLDTIYQTLKAASKNKPFDVYLRSEVPEHFHYRNNLRISPIVVIAQAPYTLTTSDASPILAGSHGYDPSMADMKGIFLASGPSFCIYDPKSGDSFITIKDVYSVDVYNVIMKIMDIKGNPNNGSRVERESGVSRVMTI